MEADTTYQSSEAATEILELDDSDETKDEERTDETMSQGIISDSNISTSNDDKKLSLERTPNSFQFFSKFML